MIQTYEDRKEYNHLGDEEKKFERHYEHDIDLKKLKKYDRLRIVGWVFWGFVGLWVILALLTPFGNLPALLPKIGY